MVESGESDNSYHLLWFSEVDTTKGSFVPSNLVLSKRMLPEAASECGVCWMLTTTYDVTCYARINQAEQFIPELDRSELLFRNRGRILNRARNARCKRTLTFILSLSGRGEESRAGSDFDCFPVGGLEAPDFYG